MVRVDLRGIYRTPSSSSSSSSSSITTWMRCHDSREDRRRQRAQVAGAAKSRILARATTPARITPSGNAIEAALSSHYSLALSPPADYSTQTRNGWAARSELPRSPPSHSL
ncbi:hypothetical protein SprV_0100328500 [Sparganum proliferum]